MTSLIQSNQHAKRSTLRSGAIWIWLLPRNIAIGIMKLYRFAISPLYGQVCRYYPSCSAYSLQAYQQHGFVRGVWLTILRLLRCNPFTAGGIDDVPATQEPRFVINKHGFVVETKRKA